MSTARPVKVLRVITRLNIGGPAIHTILLTHALNDGRTFASTLVAGMTAPHEGDMLALAREKGVVPTFLPSLGREISPLDDLVSLAKMVRFIRQIKPDVVHTHMAKAGTVGRLAAHMCGVRLIVHTYHGHVFHGYFSPTKTRVFLTIERALGLLTDRVIVVGDGQREEIASYGVAARQKLVAIPLGLELVQFLDAEQVRGQLRRELGIAPDVPLIGIVARLVPIKAHEVFFLAAKRVRAALPRAQFVVIGDGERRAELETLAAEMGLSDAVRFLGWRSDLKRVYADLDVVALSSRNEGSPVALIEALASARPVVSTAVGGVAEVVLDGETGLLVPPGDPAAFAESLVKLLNERHLAERLGLAGRQHVYPRYDSSRLVDDVRHLYLRELAARGRALPSVGVTA
ncbi:MAG TPA: glycosyltransferase family 4 protein [Chloroflexota bacterium]|nr:glycosyltransferase family 4 protein [Chloroflexota bacterium]